MSPRRLASFLEACLQGVLKAFLSSSPGGNSFGTDQRGFVSGGESLASSASHFFASDHGFNTHAARCLQDADVSAPVFPFDAEEDSLKVS